jgi:hypothetical protein
MRDEGVQLAIAGRTSLEEVLGATHLEDLDDDRPGEASESHEIELRKEAAA